MLNFSPWGTGQTDLSHVWMSLFNPVIQHLPQQTLLHTLSLCPKTSAHGNGKSVLIIVHIFSWGGVGGSRLLNGKGALELWGLQTRSKTTSCPGQMRLNCSRGRQISIQGKFYCWILCFGFTTLISGSVKPSESQYLQLLGFFTPFHPQTREQIRGKFYSCPGRYGLDSYQRR